jgi:hypothetical protein
MSDLRVGNSDFFRCAVRAGRFFLLECDDALADARAVGPPDGIRGGLLGCGSFIASGGLLKWILSVHIRFYICGDRAFLIDCIGKRGMVALDFMHWICCRIYQV